MSWIEALFLGLVQGLTEFLPVSSSGHLAIFKNIFGLQDIGLSFDILLHFGTLVAVFICYRKDIWQLICAGCGILTDSFINLLALFKNLRSDENVSYRKVINSSYRKFTMLVIVSTIPTGIIGVAGGNIIEKAGTTLLIPGICLIITSVLLRISDNLDEGDKTPKNTTYGNALFTGIAQGIATLPGISRSGTTIVACLLCGFKREFAVKYSFIMSIPAILGASILDIKDLGSENLAGEEIAMYITGAVVAAIVGYICIRTMLIIVKNKKFKYFSYYCLIIGIISIIAYFVKIII